MILLMLNYESFLQTSSAALIITMIIEGSIIAMYTFPTNIGIKYKTNGRMIDQTIVTGCSPIVLDTPNTVCTIKLMSSLYFSSEMIGATLN